MESDINRLASRGALMAEMGWTTSDYDNCDARDIDLILVVLDERNKREEEEARKLK